MKESNKEIKNQKTGFFYEWVVPIVIAVILAFLINKFVIYKVKIPSESMVPTLNVNDRLFVTRVYNPEKLDRGDIVVFSYDQEGGAGESTARAAMEEEIKMIKRLIGLPGDVVQIVNGVVSVNGEVLEEDYIGAEDTFNGTYTVPEGKYFFLGDNRKWSKDSRYWPVTPFVDADDIEGKAVIKVYPFSDFGLIE